MATIYIKKFKLIRNNVVYNQGEFVELPDEEAKALVKTAPEEFELVQHIVAKEHNTADKATVVKNSTTELPSIDPASGIKTNGRKK